MEFRVRESGEVLDYRGLMGKYANVYIPALPTGEYLDGLGVDLVHEVPLPEVEGADYVRDGVELVQGKYQEVWKLQPHTPERIAADKAKLDAKHAAEVVEYMLEFREMRRELLNVLLGISIAEDMLSAFKDIRLELLNIPQVDSVANTTTVAARKKAIKMEYARIVSGVPSVYINAFKELNG